MKRMRSTLKRFFVHLKMRLILFLFGKLKVSLFWLKTMKRSIGNGKVLLLIFRKVIKIVVTFMILLIKERVLIIFIKLSLMRVTLRMTKLILLIFPSFISLTSLGVLLKLMLSLILNGFLILFHIRIMLCFLRNLLKKKF